MIFQDPYGCLNPRMTAGDIIGEPLVIHNLTRSKAEYRDQVEELLSIVGLNPGMADRHPHEFSGGQRQRIGVARALSVRPDLIVCDEPVSALDVSIQSQILNLFLELQTEMRLTYIFIAHDLAVVKHISDHIAVMYLGKIIEYSDADTIYQNPVHPYTHALISAIPVPDPEVRKTKQILKGDVPSPTHPPSGCVFHTRCPYEKNYCKTEVPDLVPAPGTHGEVHLQACLRAGEISFP
jgi:oligopeptide/dipeptide ABC transporter ATP-binding protein